jgi:hypothetical protein
MARSGALRLDISTGGCTCFAISRGLTVCVICFRKMNKSEAKLYGRPQTID